MVTKLVFGFWGNRGSGHATWIEFIRTMNVENCEFPQEAYEGLEARGWLLASGAPRSGDVVSICSFDYMVEGRAGGPIRRFNVAERRIKLHAIDASYL